MSLTDIIEMKQQFLNERPLHIIINKNLYPVTKIEEFSYIDDDNPVYVVEYWDNDSAKFVTVYINPNEYDDYIIKSEEIKKCQSMYLI